MADTLSPFVYWGQRIDHISLKVDIRDVSEEQVELTESDLTFSAEASGLKGHNKYGFKLEFYEGVDPEQSSYRVTDRGVEFYLKKIMEGDAWPRLTSESIKLPWLKIDFDKFQTDDSEDDEDQVDDDLINKVTTEIMKDSRPGTNNFSLNYLFFYNLFMFVGYFYIVVALQIRYYQEGNEARYEAFEAVGWQMMLCHVVALLEVVHPILGLVKTGVLAPVAQMTGRNFVLFGLLLQEPRLQAAPVVWFLFMVWAGGELVRYPYYMLASIKVESRVVTWLRYSCWIVLYPLGMLSEGVVIIMAIPYFEQTEKFSMALPNSANFAFYFPYFLHIYLVVLAIGSYLMLNYMYHQRKKKLGSGKASGSSSKKTQ